VFIELISILAWYPHTQASFSKFDFNISELHPEISPGRQLPGGHAAF
jgi:hypothetical protein